ncbi:unnamed protein product [Arabis nemorensis]|uniref:Uncharacterized protein n=1 Tax=Arabis nemorensis TaxID=586526 RepID=A0A565BVS9_9BRAS|nr:unnamed protein product [Arabis nemorensis]
MKAPTTHVKRLGAIDIVVAPKTTNTHTIATDIAKNPQWNIRPCISNDVGVTTPSTSRAAKEKTAAIQNVI